MQLHLLAVGERMPGWVVQGFEEYARRLPHECALRLVEIPAGHRGKGAPPQRARQEEGRRLLAAVPKGARVVALEVGGREWTTGQLAEQLAAWMQDGRDVALLVGGPDGLDESCRERAQEQWSLSRLTLPHPLVRILLAEQLYRAWSILRGHPYHRGE